MQRIKMYEIIVCDKDKSDSFRLILLLSLFAGIISALVLKTEIAAFAPEFMGRFNILVTGLLIMSAGPIYASNRPTTMAPNGMAVTPHYLASQAALQILENGGNAVEAATASAATISVVYPHMNTIGGDNFWLIYDVKNKVLKALNASGRSGENATIPFYKYLKLEKIPARGYLAANTVPGVVSGWWRCIQLLEIQHERHKKMGGLVE